MENIYSFFHTFLFSTSFFLNIFNNDKIQSNIKVYGNNLNIGLVNIDNFDLNYSSKSTAGTFRLVPEYSL